MTLPLELGLDSFGDITRFNDGQPCSHAAVIRDVMAEAVLADQVGVDFFGVGEHHRADFAISAPEVVLAAIAGQTTRIRLGSAVTVLSSDDPVRVFERFTTLDAVAKGRAEVILGRGSFTESFPLFGYDLDHYDELFEEKLDLFTALIRQQSVTWSGHTRSPLTEQRVYPQLERGTLPTWVAVGGSPASVVRAARHRLPMMLAIIGGNPRRFAPYVELYRQSLANQRGADLPLGVHSPGHIADSDELAREELWPHYREMHDRIGAERGWGTMERTDYDREIEHGSLYVGSPDTVASKIAETARMLGITRFDLKYSAGSLSHARMMHAIELYGQRVIPMVRELLGAPVSKVRRTA